VPVLDEAGRPQYKRGMTKVPGLYFLGLPWLFTRGSALLGGVDQDAMKVQITTTIRSSFGGKATPEQRVVATGWVAPGVSMVKTVADNTTVQLTKFKN